MDASIPAARILDVVRGAFVECTHVGHIAIWRDGEGLVAAWGDPRLTILPRSAMKMIQALPLVESGAADSAGLTPAHLALACASHQGAALHTDLVTSWLTSIGREEADLRCGPQWPADDAANCQLIMSRAEADQRHNNCSGKHAGFLTLSRHLGGGPDYIDRDHPVQQAVRTTLEELAEETCDRFAIDGCSAPNFALSLQGFARALAKFAVAADGEGARARAMTRIIEAMVTHPVHIAGEGRACTRLMRAMHGRAAIKTGAEGVFAAIVPEHRLGIALKIEDGASRAAEAAIATLLAGAGVLDPDHPDARAFTFGPLVNRRGLVVGHHDVSKEIAHWRA